MFKLIDKFITQDSIVMDLYSGVGTLGIVASKKAKKVYSVEIVENAIKDGIINDFIDEEIKLALNKKVSLDNMIRKAENSVSKGDNSAKVISDIKSMETVGMIKELDLYMFEMVCRRLHKWHNTEMGNISISCNFTRRTLSEENLVEKIEELTKKYIFDRSRLIIEITEDTMEKNTPRAMENVRRCKEMGIRVALDDLGSGYTSLSNLCDYPIDVVKIDRNILLKTEKIRGKELFSGMVAFAHSLNKKVVCEGVETEEQNDFVTESDCDYIQGWYYGKAIPVERCEEFFKEYTNRE